MARKQKSTKGPSHTVKKSDSTRSLKSMTGSPFVLFCFLATLGSILLTAALSLFCRERPLRGEFIQVGYRSSIALLGAAFLENLYGTAGAASLVIIGAVPLYNVAAVMVLSLTSPQQSGLNRAALKLSLIHIWRAKRRIPSATAYPMPGTL